MPPASLRARKRTRRVGRNVSAHERFRFWLPLPVFRRRVRTRECAYRQKIQMVPGKTWHPEKGGCHPFYKLLSRRILQFRLCGRTAVPEKVTAMPEKVAATFFRKLRSARSL